MESGILQRKLGKGDISDPTLLAKLYENYDRLEQQLDRCKDSLKVALEFWLLSDRQGLVRINGRSLSYEELATAVYVAHSSFDQMRKFMISPREKDLPMIHQVLQQIMKTIAILGLPTPHLDAFISEWIKKDFAA